jgi:hypothetical protein
MELDNFGKSDDSATYISDKDYSGDDGFKFKVTEYKELRAMLEL